MSLSKQARERVPTAIPKDPFLSNITNAVLTLGPGHTLLLDMGSAALHGT